MGYFNTKVITIPKIIIPIVTNTKFFNVFASKDVFMLFEIFVVKIRYCGNTQNVSGNTTP